VQTFLPYRDFNKCAQVLDLRRLGKQLVECQQIMRAITDPTYGWQNHPAVNMWRGYDWLLWKYACAMHTEWLRRGRKSHASFRAIESALPAFWQSRERSSWLGDKRLHSSHRSNLLRKDPIHYGRFGWTERTDMPYYWPTKQQEKS
jgi:hypothetical protein